MIPAGLIQFEASLWLWIFAAIRPGAAFLVAPLFGAPSVPMQLRLVVAMALGMPALAAGNVALPPDGLMSLTGVLAIAGEATAGLAIGLATQIGFAAALSAGETISNAMGLGFAAMADPMTGAPNPAIGQFLSMVALFIFLGAGGHLALASIIAESYVALPAGKAWLGHDAVGSLVDFGGVILAAGIVIAMPVAFALVLVQIGTGVLTRSAPAMNLFAVGMPAASLAGILLLAMALPAMAGSIDLAITDGLDMARTLAGG